MNTSVKIVYTLIKLVAIPKHVLEMDYKHVDVLIRENVLVKTHIIYYKEDILYCLNMCNLVTWFYMKRFS